MRKKMPLALYLLETLKEYGVSTIFGLPGDYVVQFCREVEKKEGIRLAPLSTEAGVGFAAIGHSRAGNCLGAVCVTYGVGAFSLVNQVACAYAEMTPLVVISGGPGDDEKKRKGILLHHQARALSSQFKVYEEVTKYAAVLGDPQTTAQKIHQALETAKRFMQPVYLEIPRDAVMREIEIPISFLPLDPSDDDEGVLEASDDIARKVADAKNPILLVGIEVHRRMLVKKMVSLAEKWKIPVVSTFMARGTYPLDHPLYLGTYLGGASEPQVQEAVEKSDCLLMCGALLADTNMAARLKNVHTKNVIQCVNREVLVSHRKYENVPLEKVVDHLFKMSVFPKLFSSKKRVMNQKEKSLDETDLIKTEDVICGLNHFLKNKEQMILVADTGDSLLASYEIAADRVMASTYYATMGFSIPAALGVQIGVGERPIVLLGDGAFQMTGLELAQAIRYEANPIVILLNNRSWGMLECFLPDAGYNDLVDWKYSEMAKLWGGESFMVRTPKEFKEAIQKAYESKTFSLIEVQIQKGDFSNTLKRFAASLKEKP
jgi:indolepyruvate decarboxylase